MRFDDLGLHEPLLRAVAAEGYSEPTPIQAQAIPQVLAGRDLLGCAQTGTGKTAAFALPLLHRLSNPTDAPRGKQRPIRVLVLSPTRELASQIFDSFRTYGRHTGLRVSTIYGGVSQVPQVGALRKGVDIVVATPGRLVDLMNQGHVRLDAVESFVLDEADRMLDMGFLPDLRRVIAKLPARRQTLLFSATMPPAIQQLAESTLSNPVQVKIAPAKTTTELIEQSVRFVAKADKSRLLAELIASGPVSRALVFTRTKHGADRVAKHLEKQGIAAEAMHGNKSQNARQRTLARFKSNRPPVLVATDLAARGIDVEGVSHVFNYDLPHEPETYVHRIGRTGRAGASGIAVSFCDREERKLLVAIERLIRQQLAVEGEQPRPHDHGEKAARPSGDGNRPQQRGGKKPFRAKRFSRGSEGAASGEAGGHKPGKKPFRAKRPYAARQADGASRSPAQGKPQASRPAGKPAFRKKKRHSTAL